MIGAPHLVIFCVVVLLLIYVIRYQCARVLISSSIQPRQFQLSPTRDPVFNPNGVHHFNNQYIIVMRATRGNYSYSIINVYDKSFNLLSSNDLFIESPRPVIHDIYNGFEDMRIFKFEGNLHLIGVNVDRNTVLRPSMVIVRLTKTYEQDLLWYLSYPPRAQQPNKNWSPLTMTDGRLGLVVDIHPLLIVTPNLSSPDLALCETVVELKKSDSPCNSCIPKRLYNSSISIPWYDIPLWFKIILQKYSTVPLQPNDTYLMMTHTKNTEPAILTGLLLYQHYITLFDTHRGIIVLSRPFHVERMIRPHIEYISGIMFVENALCVMYGLHDNKSKYLHLPSSKLESLF